MSEWLLVPIILVVAWIVWALVTFVLLLREAPTVQQALREPATIRFLWRTRPHLAFSAPHVAKVVREIESGGFVRVGALDEAAGLARVPSLVLLSSDGEVKATVWLWMRLAWGQLQTHVNFISQTNDGTLVYTTDGTPPQAARSLEAQAGSGSIADRLASHRALVRRQASEPRLLAATREEMERLTRTFYERLPPPSIEEEMHEPETVLPRGVVDGRAAAGLEEDALAASEPGVGSISGGALLRIGVWALCAAIACALGRWDVVFALFAVTRIVATLRWPAPAVQRALRFVEATGFALLAVGMWRSQHDVDSAPWIAAGTIAVLVSWFLLLVARSRATP
jgi:hypothetical protein